MSLASKVINPNYNSCIIPLVRFVSRPETLIGFIRPTYSIYIPTHLSKINWLHYHLGKLEFETEQTICPYEKWDRKKREADVNTWHIDHSGVKIMGGTHICEFFCCFFYRQTFSFPHPRPFELLTEPNQVFPDALSIYTYMGVLVATSLL